MPNNEAAMDGPPRAEVNQGREERKKGPGKK